MQKGDVHYQDVQFDEVRDLGTGYFAFSRSENEREKQKEELTDIREETLTARDRAEKIKAKRAEMMKARIAKVKVRKQLIAKSSMGHSGHSITTYNPTLVSAYHSWT